MLAFNISSVQSFSHVRIFATSWIAARQASLPITNSRSSLKLTSIESVMPSSHFILCRPLLLLPPIPPSIRVFSNESTLRMRWPKYRSFSFSIIPSKEHPGLISFRMDWLNLLAVQGTLKSLLQHHSSKVSILWRSAFFTVQLSHPYMTMGKTIALTRQTFVGKVVVQSLANPLGKCQFVVDISLLTVGIPSHSAHSWWSQGSPQSIRAGNSTLFCKGPSIKFFQLCSPFGLNLQYSALVVAWKWTFAIHKWMSVSVYWSNLTYKNGW